MAEIKVMTAGSEAVFAEQMMPVKSLALKRDEGAADMLELKLWGEVTGFPSFVRLYLGDELLFDGIVDDMIVTSDDEGVVTELVARDRVSLLTDNQMRPCTLRNPSLRLFTERYLAPLGFTAKGNMLPFSGEMKIPEGMSVLRGVKIFCESFLGTAAQVRGNVVCCDGTRPGENIEAVLPELSRERTLSRYSVPSKVYLKSSRSAAYSGCRENPDTMGFDRVVYGEGDFKLKRNLDIILAGCGSVLPGDIYDGELLVSSVRVSFDGQNWRTRIAGEEL